MCFFAFYDRIATRPNRLVQWEFGVAESPLRFDKLHFKKSLKLIVAHFGAFCCPSPICILGFVEVLRRAKIGLTYTGMW